jgi:hypothetical protein
MTDVLLSIIFFTSFSFLTFSLYFLTNHFNPYTTIESLSFFEQNESDSLERNFIPSSKYNIEDNLSTLKNPNKYIIFECKQNCGGLGDRLKGIMTAYAISLLSQRQLIINIEQPCNFTQLFVPNQVNWLMSQHSINENSTVRRIRCMDRIELGNCLKKFAYINESNLELSTTVLIINTNYQWISYFAHNKHFESNIIKLGYKPQGFHLSLLFHEWFNKLFKLSPNLSSKYDIIKQEANLDKENLNTQIFCAQIRIGGTRPGVKRDREFNKRSITKEFWRFIKENFTKSSQEKEWRVFVTSDVEAVELEAFKEFSREKVIRIKGINTHIDRETNLGNDCTRIEKPIMDFYFLRNCNKAVISNSGFGRLGLWNRKEPYRDLFTLGLCNGCGLA